MGIIGDDVDAVCGASARKRESRCCPCTPKASRAPRRTATAPPATRCFKLVGTGSTEAASRPHSINILGDFNLAGEIWIIREYFKRMGVEVVACITGDGRVDEIRRAHGAALNVVQCSGSMTHLAKRMKEKYGTPFIRVSYFGIEDMAQALYDVAALLRADPEMMAADPGAGARGNGRASCRSSPSTGATLEGKKAAIYVGGAFKAFSLVGPCATWA